METAPVAADPSEPLTVTATVACVFPLWVLTCEVSVVFVDNSDVVESDVVESDALSAAIASAGIARAILIPATNSSRRPRRKKPLTCTCSKNQDRIPPGCRSVETYCIRLGRAGAIAGTFFGRNGRKNGVNLSARSDWSRKDSLSSGAETEIKYVHRQCARVARMTASDWNWFLTIARTIASVAGVVFSWMAWVQAKGAKQAAEEAARTVRIRETADEFLRLAADARDRMAAVQTKERDKAIEAANNLAHLLMIVGTFVDDCWLSRSSLSSGR
jgi:hypothetical protein